LAAEPVDAVLAAWSGLGYYRRARMLHTCARQLVREHAGHFPETSTALRNLPGIGRYTAAAIASIAFEEPAAVVDGNVERVVQRLAGRDLTAREIWQQAQSLLHVSRPGDFNQAMMELGATTCVPRAPKCPTCPIRKWCISKRPTITAESRPLPTGETRKRASSRQVRKEIWCTLDQQNGCIRLEQRSKESSLMPGMWELPQGADQQRPARGLEPWRTFRHSITVTDYTVHVLRQKAARKGRWVAAADIPTLPITGLTRKILRAARII
jgi:A/G-specific adenine glycosylase